MDLAHLAAIGLDVPVAPIRLSRTSTSAHATHDLDTYLPSSGTKTLVQKAFQLPHRPRDVRDLQGFLAWADGEARGRPGLAAVQGGPEVSTRTFCAALARLACDDVARLDDQLRAAMSRLRDCLCCSDLCEALMRGTALWSLDRLSEIFAGHAARVLRPICGNSKYATQRWVEEYDGCAFLSVDMREANCSALGTMAMLVDPALHCQLRGGWAGFLAHVLGEEADLVRPLKPLREMLLGGLERAWLRRQANLHGVRGVSAELGDLDGATLLRCALGDEALPKEQAAECQRAFKALRGRVQGAYTAVEHRMVEHARSAISAMEGMEYFATCADEAIFLLGARSATEAGAMAVQVSRSLRAAFADKHQELASLFRVEAYLVRDLGRDVSASNSRAMVALTRRLLPSGGWETFAKVKGVRREQGSEELDLLSGRLDALRGAHRAEWDSWLAPQG